MPRRSRRRTISDDSHCINKNSPCCAIDVSSKNVFFIRLSLLFLCFWPITMAKATILTNDAAATAPNNLLSIFGLPRKDHCAIYYNNALFILKGQSSIDSSSLAITFANDSFLASSTQFPSIQWIANNNNNINNNNSQHQSASICTVTSYGQAIIFHPITLQNSDTIDLNTRQWTLTSSSSSPTNFTTVAVANMNNDMILVLGHDNNSNNNNALATWILDASDDQLEWTWTQLTSPVSFLLRNDNSNNNNNTWISHSMIATTSYALYFGVHQPLVATSINPYYDVSVYCFDILSLTWMGSLLNFTSTTNHIQSVMINNNNISSNNDTLLILPDWIDTTMIHATSSDINVTNADPNQQIQQIQQQQQQQQWRWQYQQLPNGTINDTQGFWILNIDANRPVTLSLPAIDFSWHPFNSNHSDAVAGGSATLIGNTIVFYGGENVTSSTTPSLTNSINTGTDSNSSSSGSTDFQLRFWNASDHSFLVAPAWLAPFLSSTPAANPTTSPTPSNTANTNDYDNKLIIILATLLGIFGLAFLWVLGLLLWRRKKQKQQQQQQQQQQDDGAARQLEEQGTSRTVHQHNTPRIDQLDNAATWAEHLHRSFSTVLQRLRSSVSSPTRKSIPTVTGMAISSPLEASSPHPPPPANMYQQQQQQQQQQQLLQEESKPLQHQDNDEFTPTSTIPSAAPPPPPMSSSSLTHSAPQSTRNSWREGSLKASRFVEHF